MKLSDLQKYILLISYENIGKTSKRTLFDYYKNKKKKPSKEDQLNIITKSIDRLIKKELIAGFGKKTSKKWFIEKIKLTPKGKKEAVNIIKSKQKKLL